MNSWEPDRRGRLPKEETSTTNKPNLEDLEDLEAPEHLEAREAASEFLAELIEENPTATEAEIKALFNEEAFKHPEWLSALASYWFRKNYLEN